MTQIPELTSTSIEVIDWPAIPAAPRHALFDFDGTLSLIREGWQQVMIPMFVERLAEVAGEESLEQLQTLVTSFVSDLTGKQTIYQMIRLAEEVQRRGGTPADPLDYKREYHRRLGSRIDSRRDRLAAGDELPERYLVPFARPMLEDLAARGLTLYLASGTDEAFVIEEARLLGLGEFFEGRIFGARDDYRSFSKAKVIARIKSEHRIDGFELIGFGDGYVEIENMRAAGGVAVAVASDEAGRSGRIDPWKRARLIQAGAHLVIPDFRDFRILHDCLLGDR